jgi:uroporphyrinogen-III synthase
MTFTLIFPDTVDLSLEFNASFIIFTSPSAVAFLLATKQQDLRTVHLTVMLPRILFKLCD